MPEIHLSPRSAVDTDEQILDWVRRDSETALHPSCTCRMGTDNMSVVDPLTLRVHGLEDLRIVDGSVMPYITNGHLYAPIMMIAEKAADIIVGNQPIKPEKADLYKKANSCGMGQESSVGGNVKITSFKEL